jgi:hypothetical protein
MLTAFAKTHYFYASDRVSPVFFSCSEKELPREAAADTMSAKKEGQKRDGFYRLQPFDWSAPNFWPFT